MLGDFDDKFLVGIVMVSSYLLQIQVSQRSSVHDIEQLYNAGIDCC
jgi:hypothetical protein